MGILRFEPGTSINCFLVTLKEDENLPWKEIASCFQTDRGPAMQVAALFEGLNYESEITEWGVFNQFPPETSCWVNLCGDFAMLTD